MDENNRKNTVELCYLWLDECVLISKQGFNFSNRYIFKYDEKLNSINVQLNNNYIYNFFANNIVNITALVGKNGSGKSSILNYLNNNLFYFHKKKIVVYRKNDELIVLYSKLKEPIINGYKIKVKYYDMSRESLKELAKDFGVLNSIFYSNVFYDSNECDNSSNPCNRSVNISTGYWMRTKRSNKYVYRQNNIPQVEKVIAYDKLLILQFLLNKKDVIDKLVLPPVKYLQFEIKNNYIIDKKSEKKFIYFEHTIFSMEEYFNKEYDEKFKIKKKQNKEFRDNLFEKLGDIYVNLNNQTYRQKEFFKLNTIMNLIYDFYCSMYNSTGLEKEINIHLYERICFDENFINKMCMENVDDYIKRIFENVKYNYEQLIQYELKNYFNEKLSNYEEYRQKMELLAYKAKQINNYIKFIDILSEVDDCWVETGNSNRLIIELSDKNISILKKFTTLYYNIDKWGYYDFKLINKIDKDRRYLSSGEESMIKMYSRLYSVLNNIDNYNYQDIKINKKYKNILVLMDEPEVYLHPEWQIKLISKLINFFKEIYCEYNIQIVLTSNTPFLISDLPKNNVILLQKNKNNETNEYEIKSLNPNINTFAQNIHTLLKKPFFMSTTIGDFSKNKINEIIQLLSNDDMSDYKQEMKKVASIVGEPLIQNKLIEMLEEKLNTESEIEKIEMQIQMLAKKKSKLLKKERGLGD